jgi:hypothetical protein
MKHTVVIEALNFLSISTTLQPTKQQFCALIAHLQGQKRRTDHEKTMKSKT